MAQVKKFQNPAGPITSETPAATPAGTSVPAAVKKKYGRWVRDGVETEMTDESINAFLEDARKEDSDYQLWANDAVAQIRRGEDVTINTLTNETNLKPTYATDKQIKKIEKDIPKERITDSMFNTFRHRFNKSVQRAGQWDPSKSIQKEEPKKDVLGKWTGDALKYEALTNGTHRLREIMNEDNLTYFDQVANYLEGDDAYRDKYDTSGWADMKHILSWYRNIKGEDGTTPTGNVWMRNLRNAIVNGSELSQDQKDYLSMIGMVHNFETNPEVAEREAEAELTTKKNTAWTKFNTDNVWNTSERDKYFTYDEDSDSWSLNTNELPTVFDPSAGYYFNDEFVNQYAGESYDWLNGKIWFNNKWYKGSDLGNTNSELYKILNNPNHNYFALNRAGRYSDANKVLMTTWDGMHNLVSTKEGRDAGYMGNFYDQNYLYDTTNYNVAGKTTYDGTVLPSDYILRQVQDMSQSNYLPDNTGRRAFKWVVTDAYGNTVDAYNNLDPTKLSGQYSERIITDAQKITPRTRLSTDSNSDWYNFYLENSVKGNADDASALIESYVNPYGNNGRIRHISIAKELGGDGNVFMNVPDAVYSVLSDAAFLKRLNNNKALKEKFVNLVGNKTREKKQITKEELSTLLDVPSTKAQAVIDYFRNYWKNPTTTSSPILNRKGGILKAQSGVVLNAGYRDPVSHREEMLKKATVLNQTFTNPYEVRTVRKDGEWTNPFSFKDLSKTDQLELAALIADGAGMVAGWVPVGGDIANAGLGTAANIMNYIVDRRRVKEGTAPKWTALKNLGIGVGADLLSMAPGIGDALNGVEWGRKVAKFLSKSKPLADALTSVMAGWGLVNGVSALRKLGSGEDLTMDEIRELVYGLGSFTGLSGKMRRHFSDARLAKNTQADVKPLARSTKYKKADGTESVAKLNESDVNDLTRVANWGDKKSKAALTAKLESQGVPKEEIDRILNSTEALKELGLTRNTPFVGPANYGKVKPEPKHGMGYYFFHNIERNKALSGRTNAELVRGAKEDPKAVARWWNYDQDIPAGYTLDRGKLRYSRVTPNTSNPDVESVVRQDEPEVIVEEAPVAEPEIIVAEPEAPTIVYEPEPEPIPIDPNDVLPKFLGDGKRKVKKTKFLSKLNSNLQLPDFKSIAEADPRTARNIVNMAIEDYIGSSGKYKEKAAINKQVDNMIRSHGYSFKKGGVLKAQYGQLLRDFWGGVKKVTDKVTTPEALNTIDSGARYLIGKRYNDQSADRQIKAIDNAVRLSKPVTPIEYYTPQKLNAGDADKQFAQSQFQYRPAYTSDATLYQAFKKQAYDQGNTALASATRKYSEQDVNNGLQWVTERRNYANAAADAMTQFNKAVAAGEQAKAGILDKRDYANSQSAIQAIYQNQEQRNQDINAATEYARNRAKWEGMQKAENAYNDWYSKTFKEKPFDVNNSEHTSLVTAQRKHFNDLYTQGVYDNELSYLTGGAQNWYNRMYKHKSGGRIRPASEQIRINKEKASDQLKINKQKTFDKNWTESNKEMRKALSKMSDRVHDIIMKILS